MAIVEDSIEIAGTPNELFALSQDPKFRLLWDPFPMRIELLDGAKSPAVGVRVGGQSRYGVPMEVVYISFNPPTTVAMKMVRGPSYFRRFAGTWQFRPLDFQRTQVTFRYSFLLHRVWLQSLVTALVGWRIKRDIRSRLKGLKSGVEEKSLLDVLDRSSNPQDYSMTSMLRSEDD
jgi:hypothetical protein